MVGTRDRIVTAAAELFRRRGYNATSVKDVTDASGTTTGSLYHFFPGGKTALAEAVIAETGAAYQRLYELIADEASDPAEAVGTFFAGAAEVLEAQDFVDVCPIGTVAAEVASSNDALRRSADGVFSGWIEACASRLRRAGLPDADADELATAIVAALEGGFVLARSRRDAELLRLTGRQMRDLVAARLAACPAPGGP